MAGAEVDFQWTNATVKNCVLGCVPPQIALLYNQRLDYFGTLRGRLGWADGPLLLYLTGGAAYGQIETSVVNIPSGPLTDVREGKWGWTAGGGLESQVSGNVTAKLEYLYLDLGRTSGQGSVDFGGGSIDTYSFSSRLHDHVFRAGMNYKFGEPVQVASLNAMGLSPVPATNWAGFYFGGNAGVSLARNPTNFVGFVPATNITEENTSVTSNPVGATMGGQAGYLARIAPDWLVGIEADLQSAHLNDATTCFVNCAPSQGTRPFIPSIAIHSVTEREDWFATFRGRAGWANGSTLYYLTGGAALARVEADVNFLSALLAPTYVAGANGGGIIAATKWGWVAGGGMETALMSNWSMKAEYLYMDLGSMSGTVLKNGGNEVFTVSSSLRNHLFRLGLNYHLGWNDVIGLN
jgi:outer membrane immunogenic protein